MFCSSNFLEQFKAFTGIFPALGKRKFLAMGKATPLAFDPVTTK